MGMDVQANTGKRKGAAHPEMNVTPLVDVVLVLLIIFMVIMPMMNAHFWVHIPNKPKEQNELEPPPEDDGDAPIVVTVNAQGYAQINKDVFSDQELPVKLKRMLAARGERKIFFDAHDMAPYGRAVHILDIARAGGAAHIAVVTDKLE